MLYDLCYNLCYFLFLGGDRGRGRGGNRGGNQSDGSGCFKCGEEGHFSRECPNASQGEVRYERWERPDVGPLQLHIEGYQFTYDDGTGTPVTLRNMRWATLPQSMPCRRAFRRGLYPGADRWIRSGKGK